VTEDDCSLAVPMLQQLETTLRFGGDPMASVRDPAGRWPWPNPAAPARSAFRGFMGRESSGPFPAPSPPRGSGMMCISPLFSFVLMGNVTSQPVACSHV
jgi:hypothetical protein